MNVGFARRTPVRTKRIVRLIVVCAAAFVPLSAFAQVPLGTAFTYQGSLEVLGVPADGLHDLQFRLFDAGSGGLQIGSTICSDSVDVVGGLFTVQLDFGAAPFVGDARWLEIGVRADATPGNCGAGVYATLAPRQSLTATPYALYALNAPSVSGFWAANGSSIYKTNAGNVGVGTNSPLTTLEVRSATFPALRVAKIHTGGIGVNSSAVLELQSNLTGTDLPYGVVNFLDGSAVVRGSLEYGNAPGLVTPASMRINTEGQTRMAITNAGDVGIGTTTPQSNLHVIGDENNGTNAALRVQSGNQELLIDGNELDTNTTVGLYLNNNVPHNVILANGGGNVGIGTTSPATKLHVTGTARVTILEITGADVAEKFPTSEETDAVEPGTVMEIDPENAGKLRISRGAYNRRVAGVVSGAGDIPVGAVLGNLPGHEDAPAIALSGRVWVKCDATQHAIESGDLLTTAATAGHAMKVNDNAAATGATIGKAMSSLKQGETGLVLVLVNLQ
jgi:hypothetical protein